MSWIAPRPIAMPDALFENPRLAAIYDHLDPDRSDLDVYADMIEEFGASSVLDVGCGTGTFCCLLSLKGTRVVGLDPAEASLAVARAKPGADRVCWIHGDVRSLPRLQIDVVTMTGNVAQVFLTDQEWESTLQALRSALRSGGRLIFETRDPAKQAWLGWNRRETYQRVDVPEFGPVQSWNEVTDVSGEMVSFRGTVVFDVDGAVLRSYSTLRFREREEVVRSLVDAGLEVEEIRDAPDRPGRELVFIARRT